MSQAERTGETMTHSTIDINCDMGEGFGDKSLEIDEALMNHVSSINIACGFHAGSPSTMQKTVSTALMKGIAIGAHPGLADKKNFGRIEHPISPEEAYCITTYQIAALQGFLDIKTNKLHHVKPHGALYNMAARDRSLAKAVATAVYDFSPQLILYGLAGSHLIIEGKKIGLRTANEVFADRTYQDDGSLIPRTQPNALIETAHEAVNQAIMMIKDQQVRTVTGQLLEIQPDTLCIHGDGHHALTLAQQISNSLKTKHISVKPL